MTGYTAVCRLSGGWWAISVPELKGVHTQVRRLSDAEAMARDAIALFLDVDPGSFGVALQPEVPDAGDVLSAALAARKVAQEADREAATATAVALRRLADLGITGRDAARLLGISPQRVSQLKKSAADTPARTRKSGRRGSRRSAEVQA